MLRDSPDDVNVRSGFLADHAQSGSHATEQAFKTRSRGWLVRSEAMTDEKVRARKPKNCLKSPPQADLFTGESFDLVTAP
jgi:hypothetical protein